MSVAVRPPARPPLEPIRSPYRVRFLGEDQLDQLQAATLRILEEVGVKFPSPMALEILADHGAKVDRASQVVRFPRDLVFINRTFAGHIGNLSRLKATGPWRAMIERNSRAALAAASPGKRRSPAAKRRAR